MISRKAGFTLIELLVVIAIIAMLSAVVLGQLNQARGKGADAAVKANLSNLRRQAEIYYDKQNPNSYSGMCGGDATIAAMITAANATCNSGQNTYIARAPLNIQNQVNPTSGIDYWCVDANESGKLEPDNSGSPPSCP